MLIENIDQFINEFNVSRETLDKLEKYVSLLKEWNEKLNLIGTSTLQNIWIRHIVDSAQLLKIIDKKNTIYDFGSGAGLPGIVLSIMGVENVHLVESDGRKVKFLEEAVKISDHKIIIYNQRVESLNIKKANVITARALAPLSKLLDMVIKFANQTDRIIFFKGKNINNEIIEACKFFKFEYDLYQSLTSKDSSIIEIKNLEKNEKKQFL